MGETILFCFVFLNQVLLVSWFYPKRVISRARYVLQNFPPSTHPKLYSSPPEHFERWLRNIARVNLAIVIAGLLIIALILGTLVDGWDWGIFASLRAKDWSEVIVAPFFVLQIFAASAYMSFSGRKLLRAMAKATPPRVRTTQMRRRRLVDFVSPAMLVVAALMNVAFIIFVLYCRSFEFPWFTAFKAAASITVVAVMLLAFSVTTVIAFRAPKPDPYQAHQDHRNLLKLVVQQALTVCIAYPVLMTALLTMRLFDLGLLEPVITSLFVQGCALALLWPSYRYRADKVDFDVYQQNAGDSTPDASARIS